MGSMFGAARILTGSVAVLAFGCQAADDGADLDPLPQEIPCASIDGGIVAPTLDGAVEGDADAPDAGDPEGQRDAGETVVRPSGDVPFFASVTANGTGCPRGTWETSITPDGQSFKTIFSQYEVEVDDGKRTNFKDCNLTVKLHSTEGLSFAVAESFYEGYAFLEEGVRGFQTANYYFQGNPIPSVDREKRTDLIGPVDRSFLFQDVVRTADTVWSPCGLQRNLNLVTRIGLQKSQNEGAGYIRVGELRAPKLIWKRCR